MPGSLFIWSHGWLNDNPAVFPSVLHSHPISPDSTHVLTSYRISEMSHHISNEKKVKPSGSVVVPRLGWHPVVGLDDRTKSQLNNLFYSHELTTTKSP